MSNFIDVDCQSICFGSAPQHDLVHLAARLRRHDGAPKELTAEQLGEINESPKLIKYRERRTMAMQEWKKQGYRSREAADGTEMRWKYDWYNKKANNLSQKLKSIRKQQAVREFHISVHVEEIDRQLRGIKPSDVIAPPHIEYDLPERARVAYLFSQAVGLCKRQESPCRGSGKRGRKLVASKAMTKSIRSSFRDSSAHETIENLELHGPSSEAVTQGQHISEPNT
ncbi:hypothetical protein AK830_g8327 [Neonectria ditissima]|uniref:Uncharacterized protein n=1 Tax=Neonectria ditissima TaxID=78410 RepID=A0A0N8H680_9HYPO|nr:hypothetical protein AK830_g8327 [Neonectria ditissima]